MRWCGPMTRQSSLGPLRLTHDHWMKHPDGAMLHRLAPLVSAWACLQKRCHWAELMCCGRWLTNFGPLWFLRIAKVNHVLNFWILWPIIQESVGQLSLPQWQRPCQTPKACVWRSCCRSGLEKWASGGRQSDAFWLRFCGLPRACSSGLCGHQPFLNTAIHLAYLGSHSNYASSASPLPKQEP